MSFLEREILRSGDDIDLLISKGDTKTITKEVSEIRKKLEQALERITNIEISLGIDRTKIRKVTKSSLDQRCILNMILVEKDDDVPDDCQSLLVITEEKNGELIYIKTDDLAELCKHILMYPIGHKLDFPDYISTTKYAILNDNGDWELNDRDQPSFD